MSWLQLNPRWLAVPIAALFITPIVRWLASPGVTPTQLDVEGVAALSTRLKIVTGLSIGCMAGA